ncbi:glycosyltransferase [Nostoc sp. CMAA1605]|uniref:glycosyltransferase n=1 Tax=Nostoc sp. CMAA1605 TaxID=2055159 RepID=UPI001F3BE6A8|nr:glycosyltransferase [Nostoc sp. CMAA1605]MCF4967955.1 glycosyltransferase [Nostoc sp. CMAA1605]
MNQPLRIGLLMQGGRAWIGGSEYIKNIILALSSLPDEARSTFEICLFYNQDFEPSIQNQLKPYLDITYNLGNELKPFTLTNRLRWKIRRSLFKQSDPRFSDLLKANKISFVYPYLVPKNENLPYQGCPWIADFQHKYLPHLFTQSDIETRDRGFAKIANLSPRVVLSSKTAATDFKKFFPDTQCQTEVLQFRTSLPASWYELDAIAVQQKYHLPERFFLVSNQFWQHKNHLVLLEALKILKSNSIYPVIVCTGHLYDYRKPDYIDTILQTISTYGLANQVYLLGLIPRIDQIQLMRYCLAVIQPSLFEGWSTVVEDARCLGKKMILSDFPVHLEQNPPGSIFFERNSPQQLANLIAEWWEMLPLGVNLEEETLAQERNQEDVKNFGYRFLEIARG